MQLITAKDSYIVLNVLKKLSHEKILFENTDKFKLFRD